ncbi:hypothetical protein LCGC14_2047990 [marine sediment metagenome]|uniref:Uncharacterized protein n=1 Tax=marine sediment metagenome TaxID=412755 RepID=A0A0F9EPS7_9ZZZZ
MWVRAEPSFWWKAVFPLGPPATTWARRFATQGRPPKEARMQPGTEDDWFNRRADREFDSPGALEETPGCIHGHGMVLVGDC